MRYTKGIHTDLQTGEQKTGTYKILHNRPIAELPYSDFMKAIAPYLGKDSSQKITKEIMQNGAQKGTRHAYGIKYATRLIRYEHLDPVAVFDVLKLWNQKCKPPMAEHDLNRMVEKAVEYSRNDNLETVEITKSNELVNRPLATINCNLCKYKNTGKCLELPDPATCLKYKENNNMSNSEKLLLLVEAFSPKYFKDQYKQGCIYIQDLKGTFKTLKLNSVGFQHYLRKLFYVTTGKTVKTDALKDAINTLEAFALDKETIELKNRYVMKEVDGKTELWIDICDEKWRSIKITGDVTGKGWKIIEITPPMFRRYEHQKPIHVPKNYGTDGTYDTYGTKAKTTEACSAPYLAFKDRQEEEGQGLTHDLTPSMPSMSSEPLDGIFGYVHVQHKDRLLIKCMLVDYCFPNFPHPAMMLAGPKGSGKTKAFYFIRSLIDPTSVEELSLPKKIENFYQVLYHHYLCFFDNINYLSREFSDILCRAITGTGFEKRTLYTNDGSFIRKILRCIGLNGINIATVEEDLLDRTILIMTKAFDKNQRLTEKELKANFEKDCPRLLIELLEVLSKTLAKLPDIKPKKLSRMADFTYVGCAVAEVLGHTQDEFIQDYENKVKEQIKEAIYNSVMGNLIYSFMENRESWKNNATHLFSELKAHAKELDIYTRSKKFPKAPSILSRRVRELVSSFNSLGIKIEFLDDGYRSIEITNDNYVEKKEEDAENKGKKPETNKKPRAEKSTEEPVQDSEPTEETPTRNDDTSNIVDVDLLIQKGEFPPKCSRCRKTIHDFNKLANWRGKIYCKPCLDEIKVQKKFEEIVQWIMENKKNDSIFVSVLKSKILEFGVEDSKMIVKLFSDNILCLSPDSNLWGVVK